MTLALRGCALSAAERACGVVAVMASATETLFRAESAAPDKTVYPKGGEAGDKGAGVAVARRLLWVSGARWSMQT